MDKTIKTLTEVLKDTKKEGTTPYDTTATVVRIEGDTAWCHIPGGIDETPVSLTIDAREGDTVQVRVSGGRAWITGNASAPPTDDTVAKVANEKATAAEQIAINAQEVATETNQYFWFTPTGSDTGAHISEVPQEQFTNPNSPNYHAGGNLLARSNGIALRDGMIELATLGQSGMDVNTDDGNGNLVNIAHLGYGPGTDSGGGTSDAPYYTLGIRTGTVGNYSVVEGRQNEARGHSSHAEGYHTLAGESTAHAEGSYTQALKSHNHSEGYNTTANGVSAHAEGHETTATGDYSHSQNYATIADQSAQTAIGFCNTANNTNNLFAIGNGTLGMRSDAFTVDIDGNTVAAGTITAEGHSTPIGYNSTGSGSVSVGHNSWTNLSGELTMSPGTWILLGRAEFASNSNGRRAVCWANTTSGTPVNATLSIHNQSSTTGSTTLMQTVYFLNTATTVKYRLRGFQFTSSGTNLTTTYEWSLIRIS